MWQREPSYAKLFRDPCRWTADDADHSDRTLGSARRARVDPTNAGVGHGVDRGGKYPADVPMSPLWPHDRPVSQVRPIDPVAAPAGVWASRGRRNPPEA